jgi:hypothetical protein
MLGINGIHSLFIFFLRQVHSEPCPICVGESGQPQKIPFPQHALPNGYTVMRQRNRRKLFRRASTLRRK